MGVGADGLGVHAVTSSAVVKTKTVVFNRIPAQVTRGGWFRMQGTSAVALGLFHHAGLLT